MILAAGVEVIGAGSSETDLEIVASDGGTMVTGETGSAIVELDKGLVAPADFGGEKRTDAGILNDKVLVCLRCDDKSGITGTVGNEEVEGGLILEPKSC